MTTRAGITFAPRSDHLARVTFFPLFYFFRLAGNLKLGELMPHRCPVGFGPIRGHMAQVGPTTPLRRPDRWRVGTSSPPLG